MEEEVKARRWKVRWSGPRPVRQGEADRLKGRGRSPKDTARLEDLHLWRICYGRPNSG